MLGGDNQILVLLERGSWGGFGLLGGHGCGCEGKVVSVDVLEECIVCLINRPDSVRLVVVTDENRSVYGNIKKWQYVVANV